MVDSDSIDGMLLLFTMCRSCTVIENFCQITSKHILEQFSLCFFLTLKTHYLWKLLP